MSPIEPNRASERQHLRGPEPSRIEAVPTPEMHRAVATMVLSFAGDPVMRYWMPEPDAYLDGFPPIVGAFGGRAFGHGTAYTADRHAGVALWLPPGVEPDREALIASFARAVPEEKHSTLFAIAEQMDGYHVEGPHWYLPLIGVDPARQGRGLGSALMEHALRQCDRDRHPAYLESTNPANLPLYERHGFRVLGTIRVADVPPIFPMLRSRRDEDPVIPDDRRAT
jgi:ribosomal protein S18 acetylase RimI-like enzyme